MTLSAVALPYYRLIMPYGLPKFKRFATEVWGIDATGKTDATVAKEGLDAMAQWMQEVGVVMHASELGLTSDMIDAAVKGAFILDGGYKKLTSDEIRQIIVESK
jgi:alcohol dehydrogenase YqhD (iron-dependent ADH family)